MALTATLVPSADDASTGSPSVTGAATKWQALTSNDDDTSYVTFGTAGTISCEMGDIPAALGIDSVVGTVTYKFLGTPTDQQTRFYFIISGSTYYSTAVASVSAGWTTLSTSVSFARLNPATSGPWTKAALDDAKFGVEYITSTGESIRYSYLKLDGAYTPRPATVDVTRYVGSYDLHLKRRAESFVTFQGGLDSLAVPLLGLVDLEHIAGPHPSDEGWKAETWQRRPFAVHGHSIDLNTLRVTTRLKDQHPIRCLVRDLAWSDKASGPLGDGIARFAVPGATWSFTRASSATFTNPVGESETVATDVPAYADGGLQILAAAGGRAQEVYYVTNSSGARTWNAERGTFECEVNLATVSGGFQVVAAAYHDASNFAEIAWDGAAGQWKFLYRAGGSTATAYKAASPSSGVWYQIGARWLSSSGEYGGTARALSIWIDRVKGTDAAAGATMTEVATPTYGLEFGALAGAAPLDGQIRKIASYAYPKSDVEMSRTL